MELRNWTSVAHELRDAVLRAGMARVQGKRALESYWLGRARELEHELGSARVRICPALERRKLERELGSADRRTGDRRQA